MRKREEWGGLKIHFVRNEGGRRSRKTEMTGEQEEPRLQQYVFAYGHTCPMQLSSQTGARHVNWQVRFTGNQHADIRSKEEKTTFASSSTPPARLPAAAEEKAMQRKEERWNGRGRGWSNAGTEAGIRFVSDGGDGRRQRASPSLSRDSINRLSPGGKSWRRAGRACVYGNLMKPPSSH